MSDDAWELVKAVLRDGQHGGIDVSPTDLDQLLRAFRDLGNQAASTRLPNGPNPDKALVAVIGQLIVAYEKFAGRRATFWTTSEPVANGSAYREQEVAGSSAGRFVRLLMGHIAPNVGEAAIVRVLKRCIRRGRQEN